MVFSRFDDYSKYGFKYNSSTEDSFRNLEENNKLGTIFLIGKPFTCFFLSSFYLYKVLDDEFSWKIKYVQAILPQNNQKIIKT